VVVEVVSPGQEDDHWAWEEVWITFHGGRRFAGLGFVCLGGLAASEKVRIRGKSKEEEKIPEEKLPFYIDSVPSSLGTLMCSIGENASSALFHRPYATSRSLIS
jgi:hypothetical protein